jgi:hypothetical protein
MQAGVKFIIVLFVCMNLMTLFFSVACTNMSGTSCPASNNVMLNLFFGSQAFSNILGQGGLTLNSSLQNNVGSMINEQAGSVVLPTTGLGIGWIDGFKMALGVVALLTPLPLLFFTNSLGLPLFITLSFFGIAVLIWIIGLAEFVAGRKL